MKKHTFEELPLPRRNVPELLISRYRVYTAPGEYKLVDADNAQDALKAFGTEKVHRIERDSIYLDTILSMKIADIVQAAPAKPVAAPVVQEVVETPVVAAPVVAQETVAPAQPAAPAQAAAPVESAAVKQVPPPEVTDAAPLSDEEVSKLLGN